MVPAALRPFDVVHPIGGHARKQPFVRWDCQRLLTGPRSVTVRQTNEAVEEVGFQAGRQEISKPGAGGVLSRGIVQRACRSGGRLPSCEQDQVLGGGGHRELLGGTP